ncbi:hypothetical protein U9M48_025530 [Paspalum notatum var. saurae]|uniref:Fatty acyl-CoA reductase n=1 Tax=Paspalum notatum var. saurae TaxID=547442 RepID=A0AAQ3TTT7_PASNO
MDATAKVLRCLRDRTILITGSTGFLAKLLVEKILRVQPDVKRLYLLVRAPDDAAAEQRVLHEVVGKEVFDVLREKHGADFHSFIKEKTTALAGDIIHQNLGLGNAQAKQLFEEIDIIISGAATTTFNERYDVALAINTFGTVHICQFAKQCAHLKLLLHISTGVAGNGEDRLILEKPLQMGQALKKGRCLDIGAELELTNKVKETLITERSGIVSSQQLEKVAMKELGFKRAKYFGWPNVYTFTKAMGEMLLGTMTGDFALVIVRPSIITSTFQDPFPGWIEGIRTIDVLIAATYEQKLPCFITGRIIDSIPGDMVVNATIVAMATHYDDVRTQAIYNVTSALQNPLPCNVLDESTHAYCLINPHVTDHKSFDDTNMRKLWGSMGAGRGDDGYIFNFDPSSINWRLYLFNTHIPAVLKS